jgi:xylulokinase
MTGTGRAFEPDAANIGAYDRLYTVYRGLYPALRELFAELAEVSR